MYWDNIEIDRVEFVISDQFLYFILVQGSYESNGKPGNSWMFTNSCFESVYLLDKRKIGSLYMQQKSFQYFLKTTHFLS